MRRNSPRIGRLEVEHLERREVPDGALLGAATPAVPMADGAVEAATAETLPVPLPTTEVVELLQAETSMPALQATMENEQLWASLQELTNIVETAPAPALEQVEIRFEHVDHVAIRPEHVEIRL